MPPSGRSSRERSDRADPARAGGGARRAARRADARGRAAAVLALGLPARPPGAARAGPRRARRRGGRARTAADVRGRRDPRARAAALRRARDAPHAGARHHREAGPQRAARCSPRSASRCSSATRSSSTSARPSSTATCRAGRAPDEPCEPRPVARGRVVDRDHPAAAVPLLRADLQRPSHPLRPRLRARGRGLPRARHPRPAAGAGDGRGGPCARFGHGVRVPARRARSSSTKAWSCASTDSGEASVHDRSGRETARATIS